MVEPCRSQVEQELALDRVLTCTTATYICSAEPACNTALQYYNNYCADMFTGQIKHTISDLSDKIYSATHVAKMKLRLQKFKRLSCTYWNQNHIL